MTVLVCLAVVILPAAYLRYRKHRAALDEWRAHHQHRALRRRVERQDG